MFKSWKWLTAILCIVKVTCTMYYSIQTSPKSFDAVAFWWQSFFPRGEHLLCYPPRLKSRGSVKGSLWQGGLEELTHSGTFIIFVCSLASKYFIGKMCLKCVTAISVTQVKCSANHPSFLQPMSVCPNVMLGFCADFYSLQPLVLHDWVHLGRHLSDFKVCRWVLVLRCNLQCEGACYCVAGGGHYLPKGQAIILPL